MKKFSKLILVFIMVMGFVFVTSCDKHEHNFVDGKCECGETDPNYVSPIQQLESAMAELEAASVTINMDMNMSIKMTYQGETMSQTAITQMYMESKGHQTYSIITIENEKQYMYTVQEGDYVKSYAKIEEQWMLVDTSSVADYSDETAILDIEVKDMFTLQDGVYVGDVEALSEALTEIMKEVGEEIGGVEDSSIKETSITKYNITLASGKVSSVDVEMVIKMVVQGIDAEMTISMPMNFSNVGSTTVTVPENLPVE